MSRFAKTVFGPLRRIASNQKGIAAVEFALIVPVLMLTYLGATDVTQGLAIDRKLGQLASTVSDLVAQEDGITSAQVHAFFESGQAIMRPFDFERTKLRLTIVEVDSSSAEVTAATARNWEIEARNGQSYDLPADMRALADGNYLVVANARYDYSPLFGTVFNGTISLEQRSVHVTRKDVENFGFLPDGSPSTEETEGSESSGETSETSPPSGSNEQPPSSGGGSSSGSGASSGSSGSGGGTPFWCRILPFLCR